MVILIHGYNGCKAGVGEHRRPTMLKPRKVRAIYSDIRSSNGYLVGAL